MFPSLYRIVILGRLICIGFNVYNILVNIFKVALEDWPSSQILNLLLKLICKMKINTGGGDIAVP